jgi:hypothetical protein
VLPLPCGRQGAIVAAQHVGSYGLRRQRLRADGCREDLRYLGSQPVEVRDGLRVIGRDRVCDATRKRMPDEHGSSDAGLFDLFGDARGAAGDAGHVGAACLTIATGEIDRNDR